jgi:hypothetical protein
VVGIEGVEQHVVPDLSEDEGEALRASAETLRESRAELDVDAL